MEDTKNPMSITDSIRMEIKEKENNIPTTPAAPITAAVAAAASNAPSIASSIFSPSKNISSKASIKPKRTDSGKYNWIFWAIIICFIMVAGFMIIQYFYNKDENKNKKTNNIFTPFFNKIIGFFSGVEPSLFGGNVGQGAGFGGPLNNAPLPPPPPSLSLSGITPHNSGSSTSIPNQNVAHAVEDSSSEHPFYQAMNQSGHSNTEPQSVSGHSAELKAILSSSAYDADDSSSQIQSSKTSGKAGWCFIGEDRGFRTCGKVNETDTCMSGDIFPSEEKCINPHLRAIKRA